MAITTTRQSLFNLQELMLEEYEAGNMVAYNALVAKENALIKQAEHEDRLINA